MNIELILENVGGLSGKHIFKFQSGAINVVEAPNAAGKSTVIKAIATVFSTPYTSKMSEEIAQRMGLLKKKDEAVEPLVHIGSNRAEIVVKKDNEIRKCILRSKGGYTTQPEGDDRFLLTSVLTRDSEVIRRLAYGDDNFEWIVSNVSLADKYERLKVIIEKKRNEALIMKNELDAKVKRVKELQIEQKNLVKRIKELRDKEKEINRAISMLPRKDPKLEEKRKQLLNRIKEEEEKEEEYRNRIKDIEKEIDSIISEYKPAQVETKEVETMIKNIKKELEKVNKELKLLRNQETDAKKWEREIPKINEKIEDLRRKQGEIEGELKIYETALEGMARYRKVQTLCPLCETGQVSYDKLELKRNNLKRRLQLIQDDIAKYIRYRNDLYSRLAFQKERKKELDEKKKKLNRDIMEYGNRLSQLKRKISEAEQKVKPLQNALEQLKNYLAKVKGTLAQLVYKLNEVERKIGEMGEREKKLVEESGKIRERIEMLKKMMEDKEKLLKELTIVNVFGYTVTLELGHEILDKWLEILDKLSEFLDLEIRKEKMLAVERFNTEIRKVLEGLGFKELNIWIDGATYKLHVMRNGKVQPITSLSASERDALCVVLQIALKEAYMSDEPFFLIDEVVLDFDEKSLKNILRYLSEITRKLGWVTVITKLGISEGITVKTLQVL